jgi:hypothetical protein
MPFALFTTLLGRVRLSQGNRWLDGILILAFLLGTCNKYTCLFVNFKGIEPHKINEGESMYPNTESLAKRGALSAQITVWVL